MHVPVRWSRWELTWLLSFVLAAILLLLLQQHLLGVPVFRGSYGLAVGSGYFGQVAIVSNWSLPHVVNGYHSQVAVVSNWSLPDVVSGYH